MTKGDHIYMLAINEYTDSQLAKAVLLYLGWRIDAVQEFVPVEMGNEFESEHQYEEVDLIGLFDPNGDLKAGPTITEDDLWNMVGLYGYVQQAIIKDISDGGQLAVIYDENGVQAMIDLYVEPEDKSDEPVLVQITSSNPDPTRGPRAIAEAWCDVTGVLK